LPEGIKLMAACVLLGMSVHPLTRALQKKIIKKPAPTIFFSGFPEPHDKSSEPGLKVSPLLKKDHCNCGCDK
jgi:hypothetical protein